MNGPTDIRPAPAVGWALPAALSRAADYLALTKPRLSLLVLAATAAGYALGSPDGVRIAGLIHAVLGTALVAGGACALNQYLERVHDARMRRTGDRPLPAGRLAPDEALLFGTMLAIAGMAYLALLSNAVAAALSGVTILLYLAVYTPLKRVTTLCLFAGAIPGAIPPLIGYAAAHGSLTYVAWLPFLMVFFWQFPHFLAISWLYREDYARGGFAMLSVMDPDGRAVARQVISRTLALLVVSLLPAATGMAGSIYAVAAMVLGAGFLALAIRMAVRRDAGSARLLFLYSIIYLPLLLGILVWNSTARSAATGL